MGLETVSLAQRPDLGARADAFGAAAWPEFMLHDPVPGAIWARLMAAFGEYQLLMLDGDDIVCLMNTVPLRFDRALEQLPDRGVDWGIEKALEDLETDVAPTHLMAIQIVIDADRQGRGLSRISIEQINALAARRGLDQVLVPLRPAQKHLFPLIPFDEYLNWRNADGLPYDGWLRAHVRLGARIIRSCPQSMYIPGSIAEWRRWTGLEFPGSGSYVIPGALNPIEVDVESDLGEYTEPNLWLVHDVNPR